MSYSATRRKRFTAGVLAGAMAMTVMPILGFTGTAGALEEATGEGSVCEDAPNQEPFTDVGDTDPSQAEIECLVNTGITQGVTATTYEPNSPVTRRQMALFLVRLADTAEANEIDNEITALPASDGTTAFTDIGDEDEEFQDAIDRLADAGIAQGVTETEFVPAANVTRRQMAKFLVRLQDFLAGEDATPENPDDAFTDDEGDSGEDELNILAEEGVFLGDGEGNVNPGDDITRRQMANVLVRKLQYHYELGDITRLFAEDDGNASFALDAAEGTMVQISDAGTYPADDGDEIVFTVTGLTAGEDYDLGLFTTGDGDRGPSIIEDGAITSFRDQDLDDLADDTGTTYDDHIFISAYGTAFNFTPTGGVGTTHVNDATADANGELRVVVETDDAGDAANLVVWDDANDNDGLDLVADSTDSFNVPSEAFAVSDVIVYHFGEAPSGYDDCCEEIVYIDKDEQMFVTDGGFFFLYDESDSYMYDEDDFSISFDEAQQALSVGDSMDIYNDNIDGYSRTAASGFDFEEPDTPGTPAGVTAEVGDFDEEADGDDVLVSWDVPAPQNALISQYEVFRIDADLDTASEISVGATAFDNNYSDVATSLVVQEEDAGDYVYRVEAISRTVDEGDRSRVSNAVTIEGPAGPTITSAELTNDDIFIGAVDTGDEWTLVFDTTMDAVNDGDQIWVTDPNGDLIKVECDADATVTAGNTEATCVLSTTTVTDDTLTVTLDADPTNINAAGDEIFTYPVTITTTAGVTGSGVETDLASSADTTIG